MMTLHLQFHARVKQCFDGSCSQQLSTFVSCEATIETAKEEAPAEAAPLRIKHVLRQFQVACLTFWVKLVSQTSSITRLQEQQRRSLYQHPLLRQPAFSVKLNQTEKLPMVSQAQAQGPKEEAASAMEAAIPVALCWSGAKLVFAAAEDF